MYEVAVRAVRVLFEQGETLCVTSQNLVEFWVVATRPIAVNGRARTNQRSLDFTVRSPPNRTCPTAVGKRTPPP
ncbi:MAG: hypothetical protein HC769_38080 [Cyanobacteria bacterium CRU_2_1]|nr:hypothetical protein [Cyanobacteria bacterium CRU_2_1]